MLLTTMNAAIYIASYPGPGFDEEMARARAFCDAQGLVPTRVYQAEMPRDKGQVERLLADVRAGRIAVLVAAYPDCFSTPFLKRLVAAGAGLACYNDL